MFSHEQEKIVVVRGHSGRLTSKLAPAKVAEIAAGGPMQLKIQRSQRIGGVLGATAFFCLDVRADYTPEEQSNIRKYQLAKQVIYSSATAKKHQEIAQARLARPGIGGWDEALSTASGVYSRARAALALNISIGSLGRGHHIECKDLPELLDAEETVRTACKDVTRYLELAKTFDGSEVVIEYEGGEERVHIEAAATPLLITQAPDLIAEEHPVLEGEVSPAQPLPDQSHQAQWAGDAQPSPSIKEQWIAFEDKLLESDFGRRRMISRHQIRVACAVATGVILLFLFSL